MSVTYNTDNLIAGPVITNQVPLAADTYYYGMPLQYSYTVPTTGTADGGNTGDGTVTAVAQDPRGIPLRIGTYELECTVAITNGGTFKLTDPDLNIIATRLTMRAGSGVATLFVAGGLIFTITDGATDFDVGDKFTISVTAGQYEYLSGGVIRGIFAEPSGRTLATAGNGAIILFGEVRSAGIVDDSGAALVISSGAQIEWAQNGFFVRR